MPHTTGKRYAVVSCHVEWPLDDAVWPRFAALQARRPGGFPVAALIRPPHRAHGEDESLWAARAAEAAGRGPLGHHTHWTAPDHARPTSAGAGERVLAEGRRLRALGLSPSLFCGGGWYTDPEVAEACAELGYADCTARAARPRYLPSGEPWASLAAPARVRLASGRLLTALPTTHSLGDLLRALLRPGSLPGFVHVYFHDTDLVDGRRRRLVALALGLLRTRAAAIDPAELAARAGREAPQVAWDDVRRI